MNESERDEILACFEESDRHEQAQIAPLSRAGEIICGLIKRTTGLDTSYRLGDYDAPMHTVVLTNLEDREEGGFCCHCAMIAWEAKHIPREVRFRFSAHFWLQCSGQGHVNIKAKCAICGRTDYDVPWRDQDAELQRLPRPASQDETESRRQQICLVMRYVI